MRPKLTQYLIDKGYVTENQCSEALQRQVIFGGRIGTNLLELYYITEDQLLEGLSQTLKVAIADPEQCKKIDPATIHQIPEDLARKYKVVPFDVSNGRIHLAMTEPTNMEVIDEISFITGKVVKPFIITEMQMGFLLEKNYGIRRDRRFISIPEEEKKRRKEWEEKKKKVQEERAAPKPGVSQEKPSPFAREDRPETPAATAGPTAAPPPPADSTTFDGASRSLAQSGNREDIAGTLLTFAGFRLERSILFIIKGDRVQAWKTGGVWKTPEQVANISFPLNDPTLIFNTVNSNQSYQGPLLEVETHKKIIEALGGPYPKEVVTFPLAIRKKVFSVFYGDNAISGDPFRELNELKKIVLKAALSFEVLILKAKILFQN